MNEKKILFFDDEILPSQSLVMNLVNNYGHNIKSVSSISDFVDELTKEKHVLLIIDVMAPLPSDLESLGFLKEEIEIVKDMGGMNTGVMLAEKAWREERHKNVPIIFLTAKAPFQLPRKEKCKILRKPVLARDFSKVINEMTEGKQGNS